MMRALTLAPIIVVGASAPSADTDLTGHWSGVVTNAGGFEYQIDLDIVHRSESLSTTLDVPDYAVFASPTGSVLKTDGLVVEAEFVEARLDLTVNARGELVGTWEGLGARAHASFTRECQEPRRSISHDIRFESADGAILAGTILTPSDPGPFPIVVWTHGSGPDTRSTFYYHGRAQFLVRHGIAAFIYDKRGAGESTGSEWWNIERLAEDALAAIDAIRARPEVDPSRIGIAGFSQGGWVAPRVASASDDVAFVVVGSAPGITPGQQNGYTLRGGLRTQGFGEVEASDAESLLLKIYAFYKTGEDRDSMEEALRAAEADAPWFDEPMFQRMMFLPESGLPDGTLEGWEVFFFDPIPHWESITEPVFAVWGEQDTNVPAQRSRRMINDALLHSGNDKRRLIVLSNASHGLWKTDVPEGDWPRQHDYLNTLAEWVVIHTR